MVWRTVAVGCSGGANPKTPPGARFTRKVSPLFTSCVVGGVRHLPHDDDLLGGAGEHVSDAVAAIYNAYAPPGYAYIYRREGGSLLERDWVLETRDHYVRAVEALPERSLAWSRRRDVETVR
jgi:hypothetical protein